MKHLQLTLKEIQSVTPNATIVQTFPMHISVYAAKGKCTAANASNSTREQTLRWYFHGMERCALLYFIISPLS
jgi:hypothetical protein